MEQLRRLAHPLPLASITKSTFSVSWTLRYNKPPTWSRLQKEENDVYSEEAISCAQQVPEGYDNILQQKDSPTWGFLPHDVSEFYLLSFSADPMS